MADNTVYSKGHHTSPEATSSLESESHTDRHYLKYNQSQLSNTSPDQLKNN